MLSQPEKQGSIQQIFFQRDTPGARVAFLHWQGFGRALAGLSSWQMELYKDMHIFLLS